MRERQRKKGITRRVEFFDSNKKCVLLQIYGLIISSLVFPLYFISASMQSSLPA